MCVQGYLHSMVILYAMVQAGFIVVHVRSDDDRAFELVDELVPCTHSARVIEIVRNFIGLYCWGACNRSRDICFLDCLATRMTTCQQ